MIFCLSKRSGRDKGQGVGIIGMRRNRAGNAGFHINAGESVLRGRAYLPDALRAGGNGADIMICGSATGIVKGRVAGWRNAGRDGRVHACVATGRADAQAVASNVDGKRGRRVRRDGGARSR